MTTGSHPAPFRTAVRFKGKFGLILFDQSRALDKQRLIKRMGKLDAVTLGESLGVLEEMFGAEGLGERQNPLSPHRSPYQPKARDHQRPAGRFGDAANGSCD